MAKPKLTITQVVEALRNAHGLKTGAAELLGVTFNTIERYIGKSAECQTVIDHWKKRRKDRAEYKLDDAIERGEAWAVMFTLKNARDRDYSDRLTVATEKDIDNAIDSELARVAHRKQAEVVGETSDDDRLADGQA